MLLPCWSWAAQPELYSGKHKTTGMNIQLACTIYGQLAWISDPVNGARHDNYCLGESGVLLTLNPKNWFGELAEAIQCRGQQDPLGDRAGNLALQELADHAH